ncbi:MAG: TetR/AcrR family transcriptional regulator [Bacteroidota bacterium]
MTLVPSAATRPVPALSRRERERLARRAAMLDAATALFAEKGYASATLDEVAERAEFGKGTLYNYFPGGKEELLFAVFDDLFDGLRALFAEHFAHADDRPIRAVYRDLIARLLHHFSVNQAAFYLLIKEVQRMMIEGDGAKVAGLMERRDETIAMMEAPLRAAMDAGTIRRLPVSAVAHAIMGNVKGMLMYLEPPPDCPEPYAAQTSFHTLDETADFITTILFDGLCALPDAEA